MSQNNQSLILLVQRVIKSIINCSVVVIVLLLFPSVALSQVYYIDYVNGDDANNGVTKGLPWKRVPGMVGFTGTYSHNSGDIFIFKGGITWDSAALPVTIGYSGISGDIDTYTVDKTWYSGASWSQPIFDMELTDTVGIDISNKDYITVNDINIIKPGDEPVYDSMIRIQNANNISIQNCIIDAVDGAGDATPIYIKDIDGLTIDNNYIRGRGDGANPDGILIRPWLNMKNIIIRNNEISMLNDGGDGIHIDVESDNNDIDRMMVNYGPIIIENNLFHDISGVKTGIILIGGAKDLIIRYNKFYGTIDTSVAIRFGQGGRGYDMDGTAGGPYYYWYENNKVYYNILYHSSLSYPSWGGYLNFVDTDRAKMSTENYVYNNVVYADGTYPNNQRGVFFEGDNGNIWTLENNIFMGLTDGIIGGSSATINNNIFYNNESDGTIGMNPITSDPAFVDPNSGNFYYQSMSAAIDRGIDWGQIRDSGNDTMQGLAWDIGVYEYLGPVPSPPTNLRQK